MGLLSFLKRKSDESSAARPVGVTDSVDSVQQARTRARQRLVGSVILVALGVIGFPLLFETQPRPLPGDTPIEIARNGGGAAAPAAPVRSVPAPRATPPVSPPAIVAEAPAETGREVAASAPLVASQPQASASSASGKPEAKPEPKPEPKPVPAKPPETKPANDSVRAQALLDGKPPSPKPAAADARFVVQVGAFSEVAAAREARQKVEKLGLKTYTQVVETSSGKRIRVRVGPFASRDEAERASAKIKSAGLGPAVYTL